MSRKKEDYAPVSFDHLPNPTDECVGVAFSGGGIRSAAFNSGVLKELYDKGVDISYLSTVSGGGYLGSSFMTYMNEKENLTPKKISETVLGDFNSQDTLLGRMKKNSDYFNKFGLNVGIWTFFTSYIETILLLLIWGLVIGRIFIDFNGESFLAALNERDEDSSFDYVLNLFTELVGYAFGAYLGLHILLLLPKLFSPYKVRTILRSRAYLIFTGLGVAYFSFVICYLLTLTLAWLWGRHLLNEDASDNKALITTNTLFLPIFTALRYLATFTSIKVVSGAVIILITLMTFVLSLAIAARFSLWHLTSQLCFESQHLAQFSVPSDTSYGICNITHVNETPLFGYTISSQAVSNTELAFCVALILFTVFYCKKSSYMHGFYKDSLIAAFYKDGKDIPLKDLPKKPTYIVNTTANHYHHDCPTSNFIFTRYGSGIDSDHFNPRHETVKLGTAMTISAAAVASDFGVYLDKYHCLQPIVRFLVITLRIGLGRWYDLECMNRYVRLLSRLLVSLILFWGPPVASIMEITNCSKNWRFYVMLSYFIGLGIFLFLMLLNLVIDKKLYYWNRLLGANVWPRTMLHVMGIYSDQIGMCYLTDGGHYENLGILELLKIGCPTILSFDAGNDPRITHADLFRAMELAKEKKYITDWKIVYDETDTDITQHLPEGKKLVQFVKNNIIHVEIQHRQRSQPIKFYYCKMALTNKESDKITLYSLTDPIFPNEPTANQFLTSTQFEWYHELGRSTAKKLPLN